MPDYTDLIERLSKATGEREIAIILALAFLRARQSMEASNG